MKKILLSVGLLFLALSANAAVLATNLSVNGTYLLTTNRASVYTIEVVSQSPALLSFYDCDSLADPYYGTNYVASSYVSRSSYATNIASSFVGYNGYTNWTTNVGIFSYSVTNAASTNNLRALIAATASANTYVVQNCDALFARGIAVVAYPCTNVSLVVTYRTGQ